MYETFYKLSADPFRLSPDPGFSFQHRTYRKAMTYMLHALRRAEGFVMVTGPPGTGKSTLVTDLVNTLSPDEIAVAKIVSTQLTSNDLLNLVAYSFNLEPEGWSKAKVLVQVERYLKQQFQQGRRPLLIIDEAQGMDEDALEELRLLTNLLLGNQQLLQVFLVGQEELRDTVSTPSLEQLRQRLIATTFLEPLNADDTRAYINHRLHCVNWEGDPLISTEAYALIQQYSHGIPRRINQICSRLFLHGSIEEKHRLGTADLIVVIEELQQELLLPMDTESPAGTGPSPLACDAETYEEEPPTSPAVRASEPTTTRSGVAEDAQPSSPRVAATRPHMPAGEPAPVTAPDIASGTVPGNKPAGIHRKKRMFALLLIAILLAAYLSESDIGQSLPDEHLVALSQVRQQQSLQPATEGSEVTAAPARSEIPAADEQATNDAGNSTTASGQPPAPEFDPAATSLSESPPSIEDTHNPPVVTTTNDATTLQNEPDQHAPQPAREPAPAAVPSQEESTGETATPAPVEEAATTPLLSKSQPSIEDTRNTPVATMTSDAPILQNEPDQHAPQPAREPAPAAVPSQEESTGETATPLPVEEAATAPLLSKSQPSIENTHNPPVATTTNDATTLQNEPDQHAPQPAQEPAPAAVPSQEESTGETATPVPVEEAATTPPLSKEEKIAALLASGQHSLQLDRLLTPQDDSAYHYFQQVLELDPGNSHAQDGIEQIVARYTTLATFYALDMNDRERAEIYIARGFRISPNDEGLLALRERMNALPVEIAPEPAPEDIYRRFKAFITHPPDESIDQQIPTDVP